MTAPLIGIPTSIRNSRGIEQALVNASYVLAVDQAGGMPVLLPPQISDEARSALMARVDGLMLTGGEDVDPALYNESPDPHLGSISQVRDAAEIAALNTAFERGIPILAICRGLQILNVMRGGSLYQDVPSQIAGALDHSVQEPRRGPAHTVGVVPDSRLARIVGASTLEVNSRHHQSVKHLGSGLVAVAHSSDGVVEALELPGDQFVVAVQWHPEDMVGEFDSARRLFAAFVEECR